MTLEAKIFYFQTTRVCGRVMLGDVVSGSHSCHDPPGHPLLLHCPPLHPRKGRPPHHLCRDQRDQRLGHVEGLHQQVQEGRGRVRLEAAGEEAGSLWWRRRWWWGGE